MGGDEDQTEELVAAIVVRRFRGRIVAGAILGVRDLPVVAFAHDVAPERVDGAALGGGHQPGAGIARDAGPRPFGQGGDERILRELLGAIDVAQQPDESGDQPPPLGADGGLDRPARVVGARQAVPSRPRSPSRGVASSSAVTKSARSATS